MFLQGQTGAQKLHNSSEKVDFHSLSDALLSQNILNNPPVKKSY